MTNPDRTAAVAEVRSLPEELILSLLNEESGYFYQVAGWTLNCAVIGAVLAELSLLSRIDTDLESLFLIDRTPTGSPALDPILAEIAEEQEHRSTEYWIEKLAPRAEEIIDLLINRMVAQGLLEHHDGDFWTLAPSAWRTPRPDSPDDTAGAPIKTRIQAIILADEIPHPRDIITIALLNACNVIRFIVPLDEAAEERIEIVCRLDAIGRSITAALSSKIASPQLRSVLTKKIPRLPLRKLLSRHARSGNLPALYADIADEYGPVTELRPPFSKHPYIVLAGPEVNRWVQRYGRLFLRSKEYLASVEEAHGASRTIHTMDGADHFHFRKGLQPSHSPNTFANRLDEMAGIARRQMSSWAVGDVLKAGPAFRRYMNAQSSPLMVSHESQDVFEDILTFNKLLLVSHLTGAVPKFLLKLPRMRRRGRISARMAQEIRASHTPAQRAGRPPDLIDGYISVHANEEQFLPETDLSFPLNTLMLTGMYLADMTSFTFYFLVSNPDVYRRVQAEADALFADGDPTGEDLSPANIDVTHRVLMEVLRLTPNVSLSRRTVMNSCIVEGYELPLRSRVIILQTAPHFMEEVFPDPFKFDIDRYLPPRNEHIGPGYAPFGLGTHTCLGRRWTKMQVAFNVLLLAHHFTFDLSPPDAELRIIPLPTQSLRKKIKLSIKEQRHEIVV